MSSNVRPRPAVARRWPAHADEGYQQDRREQEKAVVAEQEVQQVDTLGLVQAVDAGGGERDPVAAGEVVEAAGLADVFVGRSERAQFEVVGEHMGGHGNGREGHADEQAAAPVFPSRGHEGTAVVRAKAGSSSVQAKPANRPASGTSAIRAGRRTRCGARRAWRRAR